MNEPCVVIAGTDNPAVHFPCTAYRFGLAYDWSGILTSGVGYANAWGWASDSAPDAHAQIYFDLILSLDAVALKAVGHRAAPPRAAGEFTRP